MKNKMVTILCFLITMCFGLVLTSFSPMLPAITKTFSLTMTQSGFVFTANFIGFVAFILVGGMAADRLGKKTILTTSVVGLGISLILFPLSKGFIVACLLMAMIGGFGGIIETVVNAVVSDLNPKRASFYVNMTQVFFGIGAVIGPIISGILVNYGLQWQLFYYAAGIFALVLAFLLFSTRVSMQKQGDKITLSVLTGLLKDKRFVLICFCMFLYTGSEVGSWGWMATFLKENMSFSLVKSGIAVALFWASMTVSRFIFGYISLRHSIKNIIIGLAAASAFFVLLSGLDLGEAIMWITICGLGFSFSSQWPFIASFGSKEYPQYSGTAFALQVGSGGLGGTMIPYLMGFIGEQVNTSIAAMTPVVFFLGIVLIFSILDRPKRFNSSAQ